MTKQIRRKVFSVVTSVAMMLSLGTVNALENHNANETESALTTIDYDHIEELADGGKIYVYIINGIENRFPVPPEGFKPLTASDEQLETYGFPPRPDEENQTERLRRSKCPRLLLSMLDIKIGEAVPQLFIIFHNHNDRIFSPAVIVFTNSRRLKSAAFI